MGRKSKGGKKVSRDSKTQQAVPKHGRTNSSYSLGLDVANTHGYGEAFSLTDLSSPPVLTSFRCLRDRYISKKEGIMPQVGEQLKSTSFPEKEYSGCSMPSSLQLPLSAGNNELNLVPTIRDQLTCCRASRSNTPPRSSKRAIRTTQQTCQEQRFLFLIHQQQQQHQQYLTPMAHHPGTTHHYWDGTLSSHPMSDMEFHSSNVKSEQRQQNLMTDHSMPNGYSFDAASPTSLATACSPATESAFLPAGFVQPVTVDYDRTSLPALMVKADGENTASPYFQAHYNMPTLAHGVQQLGLPADSEGDQFGAWDTLLRSRLSMGYDFHGLPMMSSVGGCFTARPIATEPSMTPYQQESYSSVAGDGGNDLSFSSVHGPTLGTESFSTADSPDSVATVSSAVLSEGVNGDHECSSYALSSSNRNPFSHVSTENQQHLSAPKIVFSTLADQHEGFTANASFDSGTSVWTQPSPSMATSTDSLPRTMIFAKYNNQQDTQGHGLMPYDTQYYGGQHEGDANMATGAPQLLASRPRRPLPSCAPAIEGSLKRNKKDKRSRGSVSRSPSPTSQASTTRTITRQRAKKVLKRRKTPIPSSSSSSTQPRGTSSLSCIAPTQIQTPQTPAVRPHHERAISTYHQNAPTGSMEMDTDMKIDININQFSSSISQAQPISPTSASPSSSIDTAAARRKDRRAAISPAELAERKRKDDYLLWAKDVKGWTYSEIKKAGQFTEAESTLRGRYRMLHKRPEERIRKPKWMGVDIRLLEKGVRLLATNPKSAYTSSTPKSACASAQKKTATTTPSSIVTRATGRGHNSASTGFTGNSSTPTNHVSPFCSSFASINSDTPSTEVEHDIHYQSVSMSNTVADHHQQGQPSYSYHRPSNDQSEQTDEHDNDEEENQEPNSQITYGPQTKGQSQSHSASRKAAAVQIPEGLILADLSNPSNVRIPWGKVSEYIATHGGTYRFGNSTCKKRWLALVDEQVDRLGKDINKPFLEDLFRY